MNSSNQRDFKYFGNRPTGISYQPVMSMNNIKTANASVYINRFPNGITIKPEGPGFKVLPLQIGTAHSMDMYPVFLLVIRVILNSWSYNMYFSSLFYHETAQVKNMLSQSPKHMGRIFPTK
jgi:hypothetical protein